MNKGSLEAMEPLLGDLDEPVEPTQPKPVKTRFPKQWLLLFMIALLLYNAAVVTMTLTHTVSELDPPYSPAHSVIKQERHRLWDGEPTIYAQSPSPQVDAAWEDLLAGVNVRVTREEMVLAGENMTNAAQLLNGDYLAVLGVYHQIHCLDILRKGLHMDYYTSKITESDRLRNMNTAHYDHCVERLRRAIMCHADLSIYSAEWVADSHEPEPKILRSNGESNCLNWNAVETWARGRALERKKFYLRPGPFEKERGPSG
ncbi:hypothetical protein N7G274_009727 [Stereocaulon virgatum]|uniref:Uncharacterized protein n=1 Tax=Stereocaulon virgatum TaxID=373712 RepID=A0ABR3ZV12_9LECA